MTFGAVLHNELLRDFSFSVLGHGIVTRSISSSINSSSGGSSGPSVAWYFPLLSSSETQGQLEEAGKSLNEREKKSGE